MSQNTSPLYKITRSNTINVFLFVHWRSKARQEQNVVTSYGGTLQQLT